MFMLTDLYKYIPKVIVRFGNKADGGGLGRLVEPIHDLGRLQHGFQAVRVRFQVLRVELVRALAIEQRRHLPVQHLLDDRVQPVAALAQALVEAHQARVQPGVLRVDLVGSLQRLQHQ